MGGSNEEKLSWKESLTVWTDPKVIAMLFLGFSAGIPLLLIFSTLSVWLREAGVARAAVTFFSWAALGYSFKFIWAPVVDLMPLPLLTRKLGRRRSWLLVAQAAIICAIIWMASIDPADNINNLTMMAMAAVMLGFSSATQDIVIDAYRIECSKTAMQAMLASTYIAGYRTGMLVAGAGSLFLASYLGTKTGSYSYSAWKVTYLCMAAVMMAGVVTTLFIDEPEEGGKARHVYSVNEYLRFLLLFLLVISAFAVTFFYSADYSTALKDSVATLFPAGGKITGFLVELLRFLFAVGAALVAAKIIELTGVVDPRMVRQTYIAPIKDFFVRYGGKTALVILLLVGFYRLSDIVLGVVSNVFYLDMGFSKNVIAGITKSFGLAMILAGGFLGGMLTVRFGVNKILFLGAFLSSITNLLFMALAGSGTDVTMLTLVIAADNLSAGIATTAFIAFLSSLTSISFTAVQYAIFSSLMTLFPKLIGGYSGTMVSTMGYEKFFLITAVMGLPVLLLIWLVGRVLN
ncbi:MAG: MFS transporter, partial [Deltaproteobacteria bacterium]|nr:MFS transporter [Deltaproteobacteria bacterium]